MDNATPASTCTPYSRSIDIIIHSKRYSHQPGTYSSTWPDCCITGHQCAIKLHFPQSRSSSVTPGGSPQWYWCAHGNAPWTQSSSGPRSRVGQSSTAMGHPGTYGISDHTLQLAQYELAPALQIYLGAFRYYHGWYHVGPFIAFKFE